MPRFQLEEGGKTKFFEVEVDGNICTSRWGHVGIAPTQAVKTFGTEDEAQKHADKQIKERVKKGFVEVGADGKEKAPDPKPALPAADLKGHLKRIASEPSSADAYLIFSDWLQSLEHPWGRLIAVQHAKAGETQKKKIAALADEEEKLLRADAAGLHELVTKYGATFGWRRGFLETATVRVAEASKLLAGLRALLKAPAAAVLTGLFFDAQPDELHTVRNWDRSAGSIIDVWPNVFKSLKVPAQITRLSFGASPPQPGTAYVRMPDFAALSKIVPETVTELEIAGAPRTKQTKLTLPAVTSLELRFAEITDDALAPIAGSKLPKLERLAIWLGGSAYCVLDTIYSPRDIEYGDDDEPIDEDQERYPASYPTSDLARLEVYEVSNHKSTEAIVKFLGGKLPKVKDFGIKSAVLDGPICQALVDSPAVAEAERLDLSGGSLNEEGAAILAKSKKKLAHLAQIDLRRTRIPAKKAEALESALKNAVFGDDRKDSDPEFFFRYVATAE